MTDYTSLFRGTNLTESINATIRDSTYNGDGKRRVGAQQALATMMLADKVGKIAHEFERAASALEKLADNDKATTMEILRTIKENTDPLVKKVQKFQQKN